MENDENILIQKSGIKWLRMEIVSPTVHGAVFNVKVDPRVEDYFKEVSKGKSLSIQNYGGEWSSPSGEQLNTYSISSDHCYAASNFYLGCPGSAIISKDERRVNLSFVHLVGAGTPKGVTFATRIPMSDGEQERIRRKIEQGMSEFVKGYLVSKKIVIQISSYEA